MSSRPFRSRDDGIPVFTYDATPGHPPVTVTRFGSHDHGEFVYKGAHAHDFVVLCYFESTGGVIQSGSQEHAIQAGDVCVVTPGLVVSAQPVAPPPTSGWVVFFPADAVERAGDSTWGGWRAHPLLSAFVTGTDETALWFSVPHDERHTWSRRFADLHRELAQRRDGYHDAVRAHLTLLLVDSARLASDVVGELRLRNEPVLADVFGYIDSHYARPLSLRDVAQALNLTPGHLTTTVRSKTGRTVNEWILERRMSEARRLLADTEKPVDEVARSTGFTDPSYFARVFRKHHGTTAGAWRRAGRNKH